MQPDTTDGIGADGDAAGRQPALLDARDVAAMLKCSRRTICRLMDAGLMEALPRLNAKASAERHVAADA